MNKSNKSVLAATIFFLPSLGFASASLESENVLLDLQAKVETLYQHVSEGKNDSLLRNVQQKLGEATTLKNEADEIRLNLQADVETLFPILSSDADEKLRSIQGALSNKDVKETDVMMDIQEKIENLYRYVSEGQSDEALRKIQGEASKAFTAATKRNEIVLYLQADVEELFQVLTQEADGELRDIQQKLANM